MRTTLWGQQIDSETMHACCGCTAAAFDQLRYRNHAPLAFGVVVPSISGVYLPLDAVAVNLSCALAALTGRDLASAIVLSHYDLWTEAVGRAEAGDHRPMFVCVGVQDAKPGVRSEAEYIITAGTAQEIQSDLADTPVDRGITVSINAIIANIRARAQAIGVDLALRFFPDPDDPQYLEIITEARRQRLEALKRYRDGKQFKLHQKRKPVGRAVRSAERMQ